ncbi:MAG: SAM-dependent methyltransferase, partial [Gaiellaceae bacterium]
LVDVERADLVPDGWKYWLDWDEASFTLGVESARFPGERPEWIETMRVDAGRNLGFTRVVARRR